MRERKFEGKDLCDPMEIEIRIGRAGRCFATELGMETYLEEQK